MPTEFLHRLEVQGSKRDLDAFLADGEIWRVEPWSGMFAAPKPQGNPADGKLTYFYRSDTRRHPPSIDDMAAKHAAVALTHESCDEFAEGPCRVRYRNGRETSIEHPPLEALDWITWSAEE